MNIRIFPEFPFGVAYGGLELQCIRTFHALSKKNQSVKLLDYYDNRDSFDILHIFGNPPSMYEICFHAKKTKKIIISAVCGANQFSYPKTFIRRILSGLATILKQHTDYERMRFIFQSAGHIICLNEIERNFISKTYDVAAEKLSVISNGVDKSFFAATKQLFVNKYGVSDFVLFTGNIVKRKNPLRLAQVLAQLNQKGVFIGCALSSEIDYASQFEKVISDSPTLLWIKGLEHNDPLLASAYAASSVFCLPSCGETQPQSALEAMACNKPIILGDFLYAHQPPFEQALHCNPLNKDSIKKCIISALKNTTKYSSLLSEDYTWNNIAREIIKIYQKASNE
ncbi:glycosyltransferase family 4 protein [bacterium]|nr:glycosyltransferase family 4 protein [bacterium]